MGLLDDAIREHLELKRRRGADPSEVEREESEALGPVRRGDVELDDPPALDEDPQTDDEADVAEDPFTAAPPHAEPAHDAPYAEAESETASPPHGDPWIQQPTREFSSEEVQDALNDTHAPAASSASPSGSGVDPDVVAADGEESDDDVLDQTPDFLQETPEHDRLWFEQKPPKDFDF